MPSVSLISVNVERSKHLALVLPFLRAQKADVVCVQELMERDIPAFEDAIGGKSFFSTRCLYDESPNEEKGVEGQAIFSRIPFESATTIHYAGESDSVPYFGTDKFEATKKISRDLTCAEFNVDGEKFHIMTTHFTWTPDGNVNDLQRTDLQEMLRQLEGKEFVLVGDFNAPRGLEIFDTLALKYKDNIPSSYETSIDYALHRASANIQRDSHAAGLKGYMVDGLFTTATYRAIDVQLHTGVSDHCAITARISKSES